MAIDGDTGKVHIISGDDLTTVVVEGALGSSTVGDLRAPVHAAIDAAGERVVIDLGAVSSIDVTGLGWLVGCHRRAADRSLDLAIRRPGIDLLDRMRQVGVDRILQLADA